MRQPLSIAQTCDIAYPHRRYEPSHYDRERLPLTFFFVASLRCVIRCAVGTGRRDMAHHH